MTDGARAWRRLALPERDGWLSAARDRHLACLRAGNAPPDAPPGSTFELDASDLRDLGDLACALGESINGVGGYFGMPSYLSIQDCLYGSFGVTLPFTLRVRGGADARRSLDARALASLVEHELHETAELDDEVRSRLRATLAEACAGRRALFDEVLSWLASHGVVVELSE